MMARSGRTVATVAAVAAVAAAAPRSAPAQAGASAPRAGAAGEPGKAAADAAEVGAVPADGTPPDVSGSRWQSPVGYADVVDAPRTDDARSVSVPAAREAQPWLWTRRGLLFVPRLALIGLIAPLRGAAYVYERYDLRARFHQIFFNDTGTVGLFPLVFLEPGFGLAGGAKLINKDVFDTRVAVRVTARYGGRFRQTYTASLDTGELVARWLSLDLSGEWRLSPEARFYGIGNGDLVAEPPAEPVDPLADATAVQTRYRYDELVVRAGTALHAASRLTLRLRGELRALDFGPTGEDADLSRPVDSVYLPGALVGFEDGLRNFYAELELGYDSRRPLNRWLSAATPSTGWKAVGYAGYAKGLGDDPSAHARYGADVQRYFDVYGNDRVLMVRLVLEGVTGSLADVPFVDLPHLGGPLLLRGYDRERFRDRVTTLASAEYVYPILPPMVGYLFADAGRAWRALRDVVAEGLRLGFGGGLQFHTKTSFLARISLASSIDGGVLFNFSFNPVSDAKAREE